MQSEPKPKWEITKITRSQNTKRTISQKVNTLLPYPNEISPRHIEVENTKTDTETSKTESNIRSTALERSVITLLSCLHGNNIFKLAACQHRLVGCPLGVPISYYRQSISRRQVIVRVFIFRLKFYIYKKSQLLS